MEARTHICRLVEKVSLTPNVIHLRFQTTKRITFVPGQFFSLRIPSSKPGEKDQWRVYSFASAPESSHVKGYEVYVKLQPGGVGSGFLAGLKPGDTFVIRAPFGHFLLHPAADGRELCFIGTGTGVGPLRAMLQSLILGERFASGVSLLTGSRSESDILFKDLLKNPQARIIPCLTQPGKSWTGFHGRVTDYLRQQMDLVRWANTDFYLCGSPEMVTEVRALLQAFGVTPAAIRSECFRGAVRPAVAEANLKVRSLSAA